MTDLSKHPLPRHDGPVTVEYLALVLREMLARQDVRYPQNDFAAGLVGTSAGGVTLGTLAKPSGRTVSVPTLFTYIGDAGRALNQRFAYPVQTANRNSVQSLDTVLTASSGASTSSIGIAAHSVKFDFGSVAYSSGSISGLVVETLYYVYADDPGYDGGAVTYLATTNPDNLIASGRYYLGKVTTPIAGTSNTITAATSANPIAFTTSTNHGWTSGQSVSLAALPGDFAVLNGNSYTITVTGAATFTIAVNGGAYAAYTTGGTATRVTTAVQSGGGAGAGVGGGRFDYEP